MERHDPAGVVLHQFLVALLPQAYETDEDSLRHSEKSLEHHTGGLPTCTVHSKERSPVEATGEMPQRGFSTPWTADSNRVVSC